VDGARILHALAIRPGEGPLVAGVASLFALLEGARGFGEVGAGSLVLARFGPNALPTTLPFLFIGLGITSFVVTLGYSVALGRLPRVPLFVGILSSIAALLVVERIGLAMGLADLVPVIWLTALASSGIGLTIAWTVGGSVFDARQAKRLFPLLTSAAIAGSFVGNLMAGPIARITSVETLVAVQAVLLVLAAALITRLPRPRQRPSAGALRGSVVDDLRTGFDTVVHSPLMRLVALVYVLLAVLMFSVEFPFLIAASRQFPDAVELATALGLLSTAVTAVSFLLSLFVANRLYARLGVTAGALALPIVYLGGFAIWLIQFSFASAAGVRFAQQATQRGISNASWSAFYNIVPAERRAQVIAFNDGVPVQVGTVLSGLLLLLTANMSGLEPVFLLGLVTAVVATVVVIRIRGHYADSLLAALRSGLGEQVLEGGPGLPSALERPDVRGALLTALGDEDAGLRRLAITLLGRASALSPDERERIATATEDRSPGVRAAAAVTLASDAADPRAGATLAELLASDDPDTAMAGLSAAERAPGAVEGQAIRHHLASSHGGVRAAAIRAACAHDEAHALVPTELLLASLEDDALSVRNAAAWALGNRADTGPALMGALQTGSPAAQDAALSAMPSHARDVHDDLLTWAHSQIDRAAGLHRWRPAVAALGIDAAERDFLTSIIDQRAIRAEDRAIAALVAVGAPTAGGLMRRSLRSHDQDARAQAIEALDSLGDRRLGRALIACLEAVDELVTREPRAVLAELAQDDDGWIAMLASRIEARMTGADDAIDVEGNVTSEGSGDQLDTMLLLRRVPLFARLEPEDLQRLAMVAHERDFPDGAPLMREGELGDELVVLVDGGVRVVQATSDGEERFIRRYQAGEHIGELAVLRERPRVATVIAEGPVRGLVLGGEGLRALLRERPEAAMAMLATLAERLSTQ
jgi:HEAT repeat protein